MNSQPAFCRSGAPAAVSGRFGTTAIAPRYYCLRALVEKGLVKLGNFSKNPNKRQYAYILTPAGREEKTRITLSFLKRKEAEFKAIQSEIDALRKDLQLETVGQGHQAPPPKPAALRFGCVIRKALRRPRIDHIAISLLEAERDL